MTINAELERGRIRLRSTQPLRGLDMVIPGAFFSEGKRFGGPHWSIPLSLPVCRRLRDEFGDELKIMPALWAWAKEEQRKAAEMKALAGAGDTVLTLVPERAPRLAKAMESRTYQRVGARFVAKAMANGAGCLVADEPGLGKTLEAIGGVVESQTLGPYLVVAPKTSVDSVWGREIPRWVDGQVVVTLPEGDRSGVKQRQRRDSVLDALENSPSLDATWLVVHPEAVRTQVWWRCGVCAQETRRKAGKVELKCGHDAELRLKDRVEHEYPQLFGREWGAIIVDESDRSLLRLSGTPTQTRQGMEMLPLRVGGLRVAMTGTPTRGRPHLLWGTLNWLDSKAFPSFWNWTQLFWEVKSNGFSNHVIGKLIHEQELWASLDRYVLRRTKQEVAPDMPAKTYVGTPVDPTDEDSPHGVWLPMEQAQAKAYKEMLTNSTADLEDGSRVEAIGILAELTRLKQFASAYGRVISKDVKEVCKDEDCPESGGKYPHKHTKTVMHFQPSLPSNKFEYLVQLLDELGFPDGPTTKVVVVSQWTEMLELFARELPARLQALSVNSRTPIRQSVMPLLLTGAQTGKARNSAIEAMNQPLGSGSHLMLLQTKTGGVAITLDQADVMVFLDETWIPDDQVQAEDRIHRVSRPRPVFYHYLRSLDTVDHGIALTNAERDENNRRLLDGRRGVEYARAVLRSTKELSGVRSASASRDVVDRAGGVPDGRPDGARTSRKVERDPSGGDGGKATRRRSHSPETPDGTLAPNGVETVQRSRTKRTHQGGQVAKQLSDEEILAYKNKKATAKQVAYADWLIDKLELEFPNSKAEAAFREAVRIADALRMRFQASPENQAALTASRSAREEAAEAKQEAKATRSKAKVTKDEDAPKAKVTKATKGKATPAADPEDSADDAPVAAPAKKTGPKKAARSGSGAPF